MSPVFISLLMAAGFAAFGLMAWRKLAVVAALAPDNRYDHLGERTLRLLKMGIGQSRLLSGDFRPELAKAKALIRSGYEPGEEAGLKMLRRRLGSSTPRCRSLLGMPSSIPTLAKLCRWCQ